MGAGPDFALALLNETCPDFLNFYFLSFNLLSDRQSDKKFE